MLPSYDTKSTTGVSKLLVIVTRHSIGEMESRKISPRFYKLIKYSKMHHMALLPKKLISTSSSPTKPSYRSFKPFSKEANCKSLTNKETPNRLHCLPKLSILLLRNASILPPNVDLLIKLLNRLLRKYILLSKLINLPKNKHYNVLNYYKPNTKLPGEI